MNFKESEIKKREILERDTEMAAVFLELAKVEKTKEEEETFALVNYICKKCGAKWRRMNTEVDERQKLICKCCYSKSTLIKVKEDKDGQTKPSISEESK